MSDNDKIEGNSYLGFRPVSPTVSLPTGIIHRSRARALGFLAIACDLWIIPVGNDTVGLTGLKPR